MTSSQNSSISRQELSARFIQDEKETSRLILEANLLKSRQRHKEAVRKFAQTARLEMKSCDELLAIDLIDLYYVHRFSAASCWAQAGNLYQAIQIFEEWMTSYAPDAVAIAD